MYTKSTTHRQLARLYTDQDVNMLDVTLSTRYSISHAPNCIDTITTCTLRHVPEALHENGPRDTIMVETPRLRLPPVALRLFLPKI